MKVRIAFTVAEPYNLISQVCLRNENILQCVDCIFENYFFVKLDIQIIYFNIKLNTVFYRTNILQFN